MSKKYLNHPLLFFILVILFYANSVFAKTDLSITQTDITFSKDEPLNGDNIRIYARVFNKGETDASGYVLFLDNNKEIAQPQPISVRAGTYDDVFVDWIAKKGTHNIKANITGLSLRDDDPENNSTTKTGFIVDIDTDKDSIPDLRDADADNDGIANKEEQKNSTNFLLADTDGDGVDDKIDVFPLDESEWRDTDNDGIGDNKDPDIDGDSKTNIEEKEGGTNPFIADIKDAKQFNLTNQVNDLLKGKEYFIVLGVCATFFLLLLFPKKKRR